MLRLSLDLKLTGECSPFHLPAHSALLAPTGAAPDARGRDGAVQDREAGGTSGSTAARDTGDTGEAVR